MNTADYLAQLQQDREDLVDNLEAKGITGLSGDETFTELVPEVLNIPSGSSGVDWSDIGYTNQPALIDYLHREALSILNSWNPSNPHTYEGRTGIVSVPTLDLSNMSKTDCVNMFKNCSGLISISNTFVAPNYKEWFNGCSNLLTIDISNFSTENWVLGSTNGAWARMFQDCTKLTHINFGNFVKFDPTKVDNIYMMFSNTLNLDNDTLNQILKLCILVGPNISATSRKISVMGISSNNYLTIIPTLSNYNDFISAGWSLN